MTGQCPIDGEVCRHDGYCKDCQIYLLYYFLMKKDCSNDNNKDEKERKND